MNVVVFILKINFLQSVHSNWYRDMFSETRCCGFLSLRGKKTFSYLGPVLLLFWVNHIHACNQSRTSMQRNCLWTFGEHARAANLTFSVLEHWSWTLSYCDSSGWDFSLLRFTNFSVCLRPVGFYLKSSWHVFLDALMRGMVFASVHVVVVLIWVTHLCRWKLVYFWVISLESTAIKTI